MKGDNDSWDRNTSNGRKRSYSHIPGYGSDEPKYIQLELNLGLEPAPPRLSARELLRGCRDRSYFTPRLSVSGDSWKSNRSHFS